MLSLNAKEKHECNNSEATLEIFNLEPGQRYLFRIINNGTSTNIEIEIDRHDFAVTEVDGTDVWPVYENQLQILPTQRYSIIIYADVTDADTFWFRIRMIVSCFEGSDIYAVPEAKAVINYSNTPLSSISGALLERDWVKISDLRCEGMILLCHDQ